MARITAEQAGGQNVLAFLDMIAHSELGPQLLAQSDDGYNVIVGSRPGALDLFHDYTDHPRKVVTLGALGIKSTAAGRYQLLARWYDPYKQLLGLRDFSPESQDLIAVQQIRERRALELINCGLIEQAIKGVSNIWASLPGAGYGQHENKVSALLVAFQDAGGRVA